jgi:exopolyphosphatase / guanosine-5'-triphosphate,3'-diphosphate pyrophosphatase
VFEALGIERMGCSDWALREGLLFDVMGRIGDADVRDATIQELSRRYQVDEEQAARVEQTALALRRQVAEAWEIGAQRDADLLSWSARLHEIGLSIAHTQYHKHGAYLLEHADLPGFSREEQTLLALLVRSHRRKFAKQYFSRLDQPESQRVSRVAILLRLAVVLHRSRVDAPVPRILPGEQPGLVYIVFAEGWLNGHPLTRADLEQEAGYLKSAGVKLRFS